MRGGLLLLTASAVWIARFHQPGALFVDPVPDEVWYSWTRFFNFHWYPWLNGVFLSALDRWLLPFTTMLAAAALTWLHPTTRPQRYLKEIAAGMSALALLTAFAVLASEQHWSTTLVKLALHRCADMMLSVALIYAVAGWWHGLITLPAWRSLPAAYLLFASTWCPGAPSVPLALHGLLAAPKKLGTVKALRTWWCVALLPLAITVAYWLAVGGPGWLSAGYSGLTPLLKKPALSAPLLIAVFALCAMRARSNWRAMTLVLCIAGACATWVHNDIPGSGADVDGPDYLEAQRWASVHTPVRALFFVDPTIFYGWSDYSRRSSFGNVRDWTHRWAYNSRRDWWQQGVERLALLGLSVDSYLPMKGGAQRLNRDAQARFYQADDEWRRSLARDWGVDYFVMRRKPANNSHLPVVFANKRFLVLAVGVP